MSAFYEINIIYYKPEYALEALKHISAGVRISEKFGGKVLGEWRTDSGGAYEIVVLLKWKTLGDRNIAHTRMSQDDGVRANWEAVSTLIIKRENYIAQTISGTPSLDVPLPKAMMLEMFEIFGNPNSAVPVVQKTIEAHKEKLGEAMMPLKAAFMPLIYSKHRMMLFWELPADQSKEHLEKSFRVFSNSENCAEFDEFYKHFQEKCSRILLPLHKPQGGRTRITSVPSNFPVAYIR